jgi:hypothetical protein
MSSQKVFVDDGELDDVLREMEEHATFAREQFALLTDENARLWFKALKLGEYAAKLREQIPRKRKRP